jgi:membrane-bound metal-dependent hydrolase YbcI (DUF457 family)
MGKFLRNDREWSKIMAASNIPRVSFGFFMYLCVIAFMAIIYSKREETDNAQIADTVYWMKVSLILVHVKMITDAHFTVCSSENL